MDSCNTHLVWYTSYVMLEKNLQPLSHTGEPNERTKKQPSETIILHYTYEKIFCEFKCVSGLAHTQDLAGENYALHMTPYASNSPSASSKPLDYYRGKTFFGTSRPNASTNRLEILQEDSSRRSLHSIKFSLRSAIRNCPSTASPFFALSQP